MISSCQATKKPIDNSVAERQPEEHDSSLDVDICKRAKQHRGNGQNHLRVWRQVNSNPCLDRFRDNASAMLPTITASISNHLWCAVAQAAVPSALELGKWELKVHAPIVRERRRNTLGCIPA